MGDKESHDFAHDSEGLEKLIQKHKESGNLDGRGATKLRGKLKKLRQHYKETTEGRSARRKFKTPKKPAKEQAHHQQLKLKHKELEEKKEPAGEHEEEWLEGTPETDEDKVWVEKELALKKEYDMKRVRRLPSSASRLTPLS